MALCTVALGCGGSGIAAEIVAFQPAEGYLRAGSSASASVNNIENTGDEDRAFSVGYSVQDSTGEWHDAPPSPVELGPGEESDTRELSTEPLETPGYYKSRVSVWSEEPGSNSKARTSCGRREGIDVQGLLVAGRLRRPGARYLTVGNEHPRAREE